MSVQLAQFILDKLALVEASLHYTVGTETVRCWIEDFNSSIALKQNDPIEIFNKARVSYPGTKKGNETEFKNFIKHKDWKTVLLVLSAAIENQKKIRVTKTQRSEFVAPWKNFQTWINGRCWEEEEQANEELMVNISTHNKTDLEYALRLFNGFNKAFPENKIMLAQKKVSEWVPFVEELIQTRQYNPDQISKVANFAVNDQFWRPVIIDAEALCKNFEKIKSKMLHGKSE